MNISLFLKITKKSQHCPRKLLILPSGFSSLGEFYNYKLAKSLEAAGFDSECISLHKQLAVRLLRIPVIGNLLASVILAYLLHRCDGILIEDHYFTRSLFLTNLIHRFLGHKIIILVHSLYGYDTSDRFDPRKLFHRLRHKIRLSLADIIITNSEYSKREIISLGIPSTSIQVIPPGINREKLSNIQLEKKSQQILCVANYLPGKGLIYLLEAFAQINRNNFTLHLVGNPLKSSHHTNLKKIVAESNLTKEVFFENGAERAKINQLYSTADIFVLPSLKETFGIVLIEAMYYGLPIITTNVAAIPELIIDGENGLLVPPANSQELATALSKLMQNPNLSKQMGEKGRQIVTNSYHWEQTCTKFHSIIQNI